MKLFENCGKNTFRLFLYLIVGIPNILFANSELSYPLFEAGQVRPLALSPDGKKLFAVNTPDARLEIFAIEVKEKRGTRRVTLHKEASIPVGLEPVAVAAYDENRVWVVNHLSDSISIVKLDKKRGPYVEHTLLVGDEPRDIIFAGTNNDRAFITTAHRGQNHLLDPKLTTPGVGRADVWVYDAKNMRKQNNQPINIITLFTDTPRALAVSADGRKVYAAGFKTGNKTTAIHELLIPDGGEINGGLPNTRVDSSGEQQPETGLIVKYDGQHWVDELGREWDDKVNFNLPDKDVFVIDATSNPPQAVAGDSGYYSGVGTVLFNMIVNPKNGAVYVTNSDARNEKRFEGPGIFLGREHTVQGHFVENRISVLKENIVKARHLNKHIDYTTCCDSVPNEENALSVAQPLEMAITKDGKKLFVAGFGSQKIVIYETTALENDSFQPKLEDQIKLSGGGPSGIVINDKNNLLFVLTRFDNAIAVIDIESKTEITKSFLNNPEPDFVIEGRRFLYDASYTSSHGDSSCGSCHIFGDMDALAWDLGDPDSYTTTNPGPFEIPAIPGTIFDNPDFRALKGPMTTQSLRGLANHGPMHWRGDRTGGNDEPTAQPDSGAFNEELAFKKFNVAFEGLNGRHEILDDDEIQLFTDFVLQLTYPPNPIRNLDNSLTEEQLAGREIYFGPPSDIVRNCHGCHALDPEANAEFGVARPGYFGTDGDSSLDGFSQFFKIPHFRNMYQKVGMFGMPKTPSQTRVDIVAGDNEFMGDQIKGFGYSHNGSIDTPFRFFATNTFIQTESNPHGIPLVPEDTPNSEEINKVGNSMRRALEGFILAFDSNLAPIVGQQITVTFPTTPFQIERLSLLVQRAAAGECDLVASQGQQTFFYQQARSTETNKTITNMLTNTTEKRRRKSVPVTFLCAPPGMGAQLAM